MDEEKKSREEILAAIKAKADAIRAQRAAAAQGGQAAPATAPSGMRETPVSAINAAGRPATKPQNPKLRAFASIQQGVEIAVDKTEEENIKKLLGGLGVYANPLRRGSWQLDYRYWAEGRRRLEQAGYEIEEEQYGGVPLKNWNPLLGGWTRTES